MTYPADGDFPIVGDGQVTGAQITAWFRARAADKLRWCQAHIDASLTLNPIPDGIGDWIIAAAIAFSVHGNSDGLAAQAMVESAGMQSPLARPTPQGKYNLTGMGASDDNPFGNAMTFSDYPASLRATMAHDLSYARGRGDWSASDPRLSAMPASSLGTHPTWKSLAGFYASSDNYGNEIGAAANDLLAFVAAHGGVTVTTAQIPGFAWQPADSGHYAKGRNGKQVIGGAQHYSDGTNSLGWLTTDSPPDNPVSAHFLVRHNPTMQDRGWQLVRLEDTAWATSQANPVTVAIEYEHDGKQPIPDIAYDVLAQTWLDVDAYLKAHELGAIPVVKGHKVWVNDPSKICPDGIDVDRINRRMAELAGGGSTPAPSPSPAPDAPVPLPVTQPDPWQSPHGSFWIPSVFVQAINHDGFMNSGYCASEAFPEDGKLVQYFERKRWEIQPDGTITMGLIGLEALYARYPERRPA